MVGRQPIVDRARSVVGYELLFRPLPSSRRADDPSAGPLPDGDQMTNEVIFGALGLGIVRLTGGKTMFCNADRGVLTGRIPISLPPRQTVVEVLETVTLDDEILAGCRALKRAGYRLAADDFVWSPSAEVLLELVDIVKVDLQIVPPAELPELVEACRRFDVELLAEKVETTEQLDACLELGFDLFQGYLLGRPETIIGPAAGPSRHGVLALASAVLDDDVDFARLEHILRLEPELVYQLVQLASQGRMGETGREVRSLRQALVLVGLNRLRGWIPALLLRPAGRSIDTNMPAVLARARMVELLADIYYPGTSDMSFTAAMFSAFDLLLGVPAEKLPGILEIPPELRAAAFDRTTQTGKLIGWVIDYQRDGTFPPADCGIDRAEIAYAASCAAGWASRQTKLVDETSTAPATGRGAAAPADRVRRVGTPARTTPR
jgi:EAL and modified HD-GYP domain-containing signal transduction protein